jgi:hypothetical protein
MQRTENPFEGGEPVRQLARELSRLWEEAGSPSSRKMANDALALHGVKVSHTALAGVLSSERPPSWRVVRAFVDVCDRSGDQADKIYPLWEAARQASVADRPQPSGRCPAEYVESLRELHEWAGREGRQRPRCEGCKLPTSTLSDALSRTALPTLRVVKFLLAACLDDEEAVTQWLDAWGKLDRRSWSPPRVRRSGGASGGGRRAAAAGTPPGKPARPVPPARCTAPGCGAPELIWDWKPRGRLPAGSGGLPAGSGAKPGA